MKKKSVQKVRTTNLQGTKWCVTIHGAIPDGTCPILAWLKKEFDNEKYALAAVAYETGEQGIHPHWQIYFETVEVCRMKQIFSSAMEEKQYPFHIELAKGTRSANLNYVYATHKQHEIGWIHYAKGHEQPQSYKRLGSRKTKNILWLRDNMKPWQKWVTAKVTTGADYRDILWIFESKGNTGKTYLAKYLHFLHGAIITGGRSGDMKHAIARWKQITGHYPVTIIIDLARSDSIPKSGYKAIEQIKNALFFSGKYQSGMVASCNPPNIVVFANHPPKTENMSSDRWIVKTICPETHELLDWISEKSK